MEKNEYRYILGGKRKTTQVLSVKKMYSGWIEMIISRKKSRKRKELKVARLTRVD